jgi:hypothetical protein
MKTFHFKELCLSVFLAPYLMGCGSSTSKSPKFLPGSVLTVSGKYLDESGKAFSDQQLVFQNLRKFAYIDETGVAIESYARLLTFPFFSFYYIVFDGDPLTVNRDKYLQKPNYILKKVRTDSTGAFSFSLRADDLLRDSEGGINISIVNDSSNSNLFGKYSFVVKNIGTDLGTLGLCSLGGIMVSEDTATDSSIFSWAAPSTPVSRYVLRFGDPNTGSVIWTQVVDGSLTTLTLPRSLFLNQSVRLGIEAFYTFEVEKKISCLSAPKDFKHTSPLNSLASGSIVNASNIKFKINSLTNTKFSDNPFFEAFDSREFVLDLGEQKLVSRLLLYNLQLQTSGSLSVSGSLDGVTYTSIEQFEEKRFMNLSLATPTTSRYLKFSFSSRLIDLQELALF